MEIIIGGAIIWLLWWLIKGRKEYKTRKRWETAPYENKEIAQEFGWQVCDTGKNLFDTPTIEMKKIEPLPKNLHVVWEDDFSTELTLHISKTGSMLFGYNKWLKFEEMNPTGSKEQREFDIVEIEKNKREMLNRAVKRLEEMGAVNCHY